MSDIAHLTNAIGAIVGSEAAQAKHVTAAASRLFASHFVTTSFTLFLDAMSTPGTLLDLQVLQLRLCQLVSLLFLLDLSIVLKACAAFMPRTLMCEAGLAPALVARHDGRIVLACVLLAVATARMSTPQELLVGCAQAVAQQQLIVGVEIGWHRPSLHFTMFHHRRAAWLRACEPAIAFKHLSRDVSL